MDQLLVILGPTAIGKTDIALLLAKKLNGELISADSRQVYKGLDIGTGKEPGKSSHRLRIKKGEGWWEIGGVKVWLYDVVSPQVQYTVYDYVQNAGKVIEDIHKRGKLPIIVGGTGFYIKGLLEGFEYLNVPIDQKLRGELQKFSLAELQEKLQLLSPIKWKSLNQSDKKNPRRLLRSIEIISMNPYINKNQNLKIKDQKWDILKIGLSAPRPVLYQRINQRVYSRVEQGMMKEGEGLHQTGLTLPRMKELGLEYGMLADLLSGKINQEQFIRQLQVKIHHYAKRQLTWFKKDTEIHWFDITEPEYYQKVESLVDSWYYPIGD